MSKTQEVYRLTVNVFYMDIDDTFTIDVPISDEEVAKITEAAIHYYWAVVGKAEDEYLFYAPEAQNKAMGLAKDYCANKWGEQPWMDNVAYFEFLLPEDFWDRVHNDEKYQAEVTYRERREMMSRTQCFQERKLLVEENERGRFKDRICTNPLTNSVFSGCWIPGENNRAGDYCFDAYIKTNGGIINAHYFKLFEKDDAQLEISIENCDQLTSFFEAFCRKYSKEFGYDSYEFSSNTFRTQSKEGNCDVELFAKLLDEIIEFTEQSTIINFCES